MTDRRTFLIISITALFLTSCVLTGCSMKQLRQEIVGYSMDDVRNSKNKQVLVVAMNGPDCMAKIKEVLTSMQAIVREDAGWHYIYADNLQHAFRPAIDTTQVGIVVTWLEQNKSQLEIASENKDLAVFVAKELSKKLKP